MKSNRFVLIGLASMAIATAVQAQFNPVPLTSSSFTYGIVVGTNVAAGENGISTVITTTCGGGTGEGDYTFCEQGWVYPKPTTGWNVGVPAHNTFLTNINNANMVFLMPPTYVTNNVLQVIAANGSGRGNIASGTFVFTTPTTASSLAILNMDGNGDQTITYTVTYQTGAPTTGTMSTHDWFDGGSTVAWGANGRVSTGGYPGVYATTYGYIGNYNSSSVNNNVPYLYANTISTTTTSPIISIEFSSPVNSGPVNNFFAVSGSINGTTYTPIPVQGFNEKAIIPTFVPYPVTATMDNGTNIGNLTNSSGNNGNTWFEMGYDTASPTNGLPASGSTFTTPLGHKYQMGSYALGANNAVLIDAQHLSANIVPVSPQPYTAFAFLTAGANDNGSPGYMLNKCILQHQGGINETNYFKGYDWFNDSVPSAWSASGRVAISYVPWYFSGFNNVGTANPNLFETFFSLTDTNDTVTNIVVQYYQAPSGTSTTYIMAVSASAGGLAPLVSSGPLPTTQSWYVGQTATFTVEVAGTQPITSFWAVQDGDNYNTLTNGTYPDGSVVSGATTTTLTISNVQLDNATNYYYAAENVVGDSPVAGPASLVVSNDIDATAPMISQNPTAAESPVLVFTNETTEFEVAVNNGASPPIGYQWYNGATAILNATNAGYVFSNLDNVSLSCVVSNIAGTVTSDPVMVSMTLKSPISSPAPYQTALLGYDVVGYWPLDETGGIVAYDLVGNNNGIYLGNYQLGQPGVTGANALGSTTSVAFDGSSAYVDIPVNDLNITGPMTVVAWVKTTGTGFSSPVGHADQSYRLDVDTGGIAHFADSGPDVDSVSSVADGNWHQLVGVYDGANENIYVDALPVVSSTSGGPGSGSQDDVWIGGAPDYGLTRLFNGNICQVSIIAGALTASEVSSLYYDAGFPPTFTENLNSPLLSEVPVGTPMSYSVTAGGPSPLYYQWYTNGSADTSANGSSSSYAFDAAAGTNTYYVGVSNAYGNITSSTATVIGDVTNPPPFITIGDGTGWQLNAASGTTFTATIFGTDSLELTDGGGGEGSSAFYVSGQYVGGFVASFTYEPSGGADGVTICLQNSSAGTNAVGAPGGDLAYYGITPSVAFELNIYTGANGGVGIQLGTNGGTPDSVNPTPGYSGTGSVNVASTDNTYVQLYYLQGDLQVWLMDATTFEVFTTNYSIGSLSDLLGNGSAYVGLTGSDGGVDSFQLINDFSFSYTTAPVLSVAQGATPGTVVISWPISVSTSFQLVQTSSLSTVPLAWSPVGVPPVPSPDGTQNQVTLTPGAGPWYYSLQLVIPAPYGPPN